MILGKHVDETDYVWGQLYTQVERKLYDEIWNQVSYRLQRPLYTRTSLLVSHMTDELVKRQVVAQI